MALDKEIQCKEFGECRMRLQEAKQILEDNGCEVRGRLDPELSGKRYVKEIAELGYEYEIEKAMHDYFIYDFDDEDGCPIFWHVPTIPCAYVLTEMSDILNLVPYEEFVKIFGTPEEFVKNYKNIDWKNYKITESYNPNQKERMVAKLKSFPNGHVFELNKKDPLTVKFRKLPFGYSIVDNETGETMVMTATLEELVDEIEDLIENWDLVVKQHFIDVARQEGLDP